MRFEGLDKLAVAIGVLGWAAVVLGVVVAVVVFDDRDPLPALMLGGACVGSGLMIVLTAGVARAVAFIAHMQEEGRNAPPVKGGGVAPGVLIEVRYGQELRAIGRGRYWAAGSAHDSRAEAESAIRALKST